MTTTAKPSVTAPAAPRVLTPESITEQHRPRLGGKAENLWVMTRQGFPVPPWFVVTTDAYREAVGDKAAKALPSGEKARAAVLGVELPKAAQKEILDELRKRFRRKDGGFELVAVRSSAVGEDSEGTSFAGQHDTILFVKGEEAVLKAIKRCWSSAFTDRALAYRAEKGIDPSRSEVAVVIQQMVFGDASGVMFTANPQNGRRDEILINSVWGIGEGIVSGALDADAFTVRRGSQWVKTELTRKERKVAFHEEAGEGTIEVEVHPDDAAKPSLTREQVLEIAALGERCERHYGRPQDMEFAVAGGKVYLLQTRPITALPDDAQELSDEGFEPMPGVAAALKRLAQGRETIWDNSNIVESYSGVTTPLTFSFASRAYYYVYFQFCEVIGVPRDEILKNEQVLRNMIGLVKGRVFYNLRNWYRLIAFLPGYDFNKDFMAAMMGLKETADTGDRKELSKFDKYAKELPKMLFRGGKLGAQFYTIDAWVEEFFAMFKKVHKEYREKDFDAMSVDDLVAAYRDLEARVMWSWKAPIINDFAAMIYYGVLKRLVTKWVEPDPRSSIQND
ncbi:MAG TPA: PEP/pyruvate-binding domain-containing protein, partial [Planctomycetota bacterium]|nr:PEP/pyruvate-binding domain-containing protein [Planctomycetota bacterium]